MHRLTSVTVHKLSSILEQSKPGKLVDGSSATPVVCIYEKIKRQTNIFFPVKNASDFVWQ